MGHDQPGLGAAAGDQVKPDQGHLEAFDRSLTNNTAKHRRLTMTRVRRVVEGRGFRTLAELDGEKVVAWLNEFREEKNLGARTYNHHPQAADAFGKWLAMTKRLPGNPLVGRTRRQCARNWLFSSGGGSPG